MSLSKERSSLRFTTSEKQKQQLVIDNHIFNKCSIRPNGDIYWRCVERNSINDGQMIHECKSTCTTRSGQLRFPPTAHNHEALHTNESISLNQDLKANIKKRAREDKRTPVPQIYKEEIAKLTLSLNIEQTEENAIKIKPLKNYTTSIYKEKNTKGNIDELVQKRPKLVEEIDLQDPIYQETVNNKVIIIRIE